ncbi:helix-hairpin-helix domain-containing protein [Pallidibacillus pasinlerensis]|uniref:Helix-hairpin-helix DNA-binding motif class 1 domain-containing protein n=1 Tax=Pallidibacillus pasinlerensis TaxID=2703818 RepID=A0ABX0A223_9BACI|nr:helix-hairpin-helix domain-containing protein [Pallidibacillus pasinlerensis]NCU17476.1 hypothetical protein [Pallidibacillus pasinlerensis]
MIQWIMEKKQYFLIGAIILGVFIYYLVNDAPDDTIQMLEEEIFVENEEEIRQQVDSNDDKIVEQPIIIKVDLKGAVQKPGVYTAQEGERVIDLINRAGGFLDDADQTKINLSQKVADEMVIYVPKVGEDSNVMDQVASFFQPQQSGNEASSDGKVNINQADSTLLQTLPGIGPSKAEAIIEYRETNGPFKMIEDIMNISGIGEKTFEKLKNSITVQ